MVLLVVAALALGAWAVAAQEFDQFDAYFATAKGDRITGPVQEGTVVYVAVQGTGRYCGMDEFKGDILIFDFKTGAYVEVYEAWFRELGGPGSGLFFWVTGETSSVKVGVPLGSRMDFSAVEGQVHVLGLGDGDVALIPPEDMAGNALEWAEGWWSYDETGERVEFEANGRLENNDTIILMVRDLSDPLGRVIDQDQLKILDTQGVLTVTPANVDYGCAECPNINIKVVDPDENLNPNEIEYVPVFVIINPGSWNPDPEVGINNFCGFLRQNEIRWYNIYEEWFLDYVTETGEPPLWWPTGADETEILAVVFVPEEGPAAGTFSLNLGNLEDFQEYLWGDPEARNYKFPMGTTFSFYYIDPNDFDDMDLGWFRVAYSEDTYSRTMLTDNFGRVVDTVKLGWDGLYVRVVDGDANVELCCCDQILVHLCDPHNEDDSEYLILDEVSPNAGIFFTLGAVPLLPGWDAVGGFKLVFDDWRVQAFNEDTIFAQYNSVDHDPEGLNTLGDGDDEDFPPRIFLDRETGEPLGRYQYWDVSFAKVKVYDTQVFNGQVHKMYFVDCAGNRILTERLPSGGMVGLMVEDPDQNEEPRLSELISWKWDVVDGNIAGSDPLIPAVLEEFLNLNPESLTRKASPMKIFVVNASNGEWEPLYLRETQPNSGIFRSTTCVLLTGSAVLGHEEGTLRANPGDTIMAFYQDPSNHSDISIISARVSLGGAGEVPTPPVTASVTFDKDTYYPGDTVRITVTDTSFAGAGVVPSTNILVLKDKDGAVLQAWNELTFDAQGKATVTYTLLETVKLGTITVVYTNPVTGTPVQDQATVVAKALSNVTGITPAPNPFKTSTTFTIAAEPAGAVAAKITITIYDLTGAKVDAISGQNTASVTWNGGNLRNGAYIYVAVVEGAGKSWTFKGFVYIER